MLSPLSIAAYVVTSALIAGVELLRRKQTPIDALTLINLLYFLMYCFVPLNINFLEGDTFRQAYAFSVFGPGDEFHAAVILISYLLIVLGYFFATRIGAGGTRIDLAFGPKAVRSVAAVLLILGLVGFAARVFELGGVSDALVYSAVIRTGDIQIESPIAFTWIFLGAPLAGLMLLWASHGDQGSVPAGTHASKSVEATVLVLYGALAVLVYVSASGRRDFLIVPLLMLLAHANAANRFPGRWLALLGVFGVALLAYAPPLMFGLAYGNLGETLGSDLLGPLQAAYTVTVQILGDGYIHWVGMSTVPVGKMGFFADWANMPLKLLPSRLLGFDRTRDILGEASSLFNGVDLRGFASAGEDEPPGFFGYFYASLGVAGVVAGAWIFGVFSGLMHRLLSPKAPHRLVPWVLYWWIVFACCSFLRDGYPEFILKERFTWWLALALLFTHRWAGRIGVRAVRLERP